MFTIQLLKFLHLLIVLSLLGTMSYVFWTKIKNPARSLTYHYKNMLYLAFFGILTGTLLVYPKHFTFHTPWIMAAYFFLILFSLVTLFLKKHNKTSAWMIHTTHLFLIVVLILVIHDAVTKTTFL